MRRKRVLAVASAGGHLVQLRRLRPAWDDCDVTYLTTDPGFRADIEADAAARGQPRPGYIAVTEANRWQKFRLLKQAAEVVIALLKVRPDVIISTGAAPGFFAIRVGRWMRARTVWVDSIANAEEMSMSGRLARRFATHWLSQWEHVAEAEGAAFLGAVL